MPNVHESFRIYREATKTQSGSTTLHFRILHFSVAKQVWEEEETKLAEQVNWYPKKLLNFPTILLYTVSEKTYDNKKNKEFLLLHWNFNHTNCSV